MPSAKENVTEILKKMGISKVYHIDDRYEEKEKEINIDQVLADFDSIEEDKLREIFVEKKKDFVSDKDIDKDTLRKIWEDLGANDRNNILLDINTSFVWDKQALVLVKELFDEKIISKKNPQEWEKSRDDIITELKDNKFLFLFDENWGEGKEKAGIEEIKKLLAIKTIPKENLLCGLFTYTVSPENEYSIRKKLALEQEISPSSFLVISKKHKKNTFILSFRTTALIPTLLDFKKTVEKSITEATNSVQTYIENLDIADLEYIVLDKSMNEGVWEPEILYRLHKNRHIKEFRSEIFMNATIQSKIEIMRKIKMIGEQEKIKPTDETKKLMQYEYYDTKINDYNCPLKSGDIFEKNKNKKKYILLAQPCDLMIRTNGKRSFDDYRYFVNLVEITNKGDRHPLDYYDMNESWYIKYSCAQKVELDILDLCVFNDDGEVMIDLNETKKTHKLNGLCSRYRKIHKKIKKIFDLWSEAESAVTNRELLKKQFFTPHKQSLYHLEVKKKEKIIDFGLKRVSRLSKEKAQVFLSEFLQHQGRPASEVDLTDNLKDKE